MALPLSLVGRVNLVKMLYVPKFLYFLRNTPIPIAKVSFVKLDSIISSFVWAGKTPRLAQTTLQLPLTRGGLALPNLQLYYWAAVLVTVLWWCSICKICTRHGKEVVPFYLKIKKEKIVKYLQPNNESFF